jgi:uncharacterized membrane protein YbaN (DUF454 family)
MPLKIMVITLAGFMLLGMGIVGLALPIWPTTPFVIAAAGCFSYVPSIRAKIMDIPFFREYMKTTSKRNGLSRRTSSVQPRISLGMLAFFRQLYEKNMLTVLLAAVGAAVTLHILWMAKPREARRPGQRRQNKTTNGNKRFFGLDTRRFSIFYIWHGDLLWAYIFCSILPPN